MVGDGDVLIPERRRGIDHGRDGIPPVAVLRVHVKIAAHVCAADQPGEASTPCQLDLPVAFSNFRWDPRKVKACVDGLFRVRDFRRVASDQAIGIETMRSGRGEIAQLLEVCGCAGRIQQHGAAEARVRAADADLDPIDAEAQAVPAPEQAPRIRRFRQRVEDRTRRGRRRDEFDVADRILTAPERACGLGPGNLRQTTEHIQYGLGGQERAAERHARRRSTEPWQCLQDRRFDGFAEPRDRAQRAEAHGVVQIGCGCRTSCRLHGGQLGGGDRIGFEKPAKVRGQVGDCRLEQHPAPGVVHVAELPKNVLVRVCRRLRQQRSQVPVGIDPSGPGQLRTEREGRLVAQVSAYPASAASSSSVAGSEPPAVLRGVSEGEG